MDGIGQRIREIRRSKDWTLEELSSRCGLSISFLSQVERGLSSLSISSLRAICEALDLPLTYFLSPTPAGPIVAKGGEPRSRIRFEDSGVTYGILSDRFPTRTLEALFADYPPHYDPPMITHEGEEFGYVMEGRLVLQVEDEVHELEPGDSFHFVSARRHTVRNPFDQPARTLWVVTMKLTEGGP